MKLTKRVVALLLCAALALTVLGCSLKDDPNQAVATVNGAKITKSDFDATVEQYSSFYAQFGMDPSTDPSVLNDVMHSALDTLIEEQVLSQKAKELGFDKVTLEEAKASKSPYAVQLEEYKETFREQAKTEGAADVEKRADELFWAAIQGQGMTQKEIEDALIEDYKRYKLEQSVKEKITVTDEEVKAWYDTNVAKQTEDLKTNDTAYEQYDETNPALVIPEGYVSVKQIFLKPADDATVSAKIEEFTATIEDLATQMAELLKEGKDKNSVEFVELETKMAAARADSAKVRDAWLAPAKAKADEASAKALAGEDFDKLVEQYNEDPGMKTEPMKSKGYAVGKQTTKFVEPFKTAALALTNIGDVSPVVASDMGYHILKLVEKLTPGTVAFEQVKDICKAKALEEKQNDAYAAQVKDWVSKAKVVPYEDRINYPDVPAEAPEASPAQ